MIYIGENRPVNAIIRYKNGNKKTIKAFGVDIDNGRIDVYTFPNGHMMETTAAIKTVLFNGRRVWYNGPVYAEKLLNPESVTI